MFTRVFSSWLLIASLAIPSSSFSFPFSFWNSGTVTPHVFAAIAASTTSAAYSDDGKTWTAATMPVSETWSSIAWFSGASMYVAVSQDGTNRFAWSKDGQTWNLGTDPASNTSWFSVTCSPTKCVAISNLTGNNTVAYSTDGKTWTNANTPSWNGCSGARCIVWDSTNSKFEASSNGGSTWVSSTDGITWNTLTGCVATLGVTIAFSPSIPIYATVGSVTGNACSSTDGTSGTWTSRTFAHAAQTSTWSTTFSEFIACGNTPVGCTKSTNGTSWSDITTSVAAQYTGVACSPSLALCVTMFNNTGAGNQFFWTSDGSTWNRVAESANVAWADVAASK